MRAFLAQSRSRRLLPLPTTYVWLYRRFKDSIESNPRSRPSCYTTSPPEGLFLSWLQHVTNSRLVIHQSKGLTFFLQQKGQRCVIQYTTLTSCLPRPAPTIAAPSERQPLVIYQGRATPRRAPKAPQSSRACKLWSADRSAAAYCVRYGWRSGSVTR